VVQFDTNKT